MPLAENPDTPQVIAPVDSPKKDEPLFEEIRYHADKLEMIVDDKMWPLPKYRELLFMR